MLLVQGWAGLSPVIISQDAACAASATIFYLSQPQSNETKFAKTGVIYN